VLPTFDIIYKVSIKSVAPHHHRTNDIISTIIKGGGHKRMRKIKSFTDKEFYQFEIFNFPV
jgi:hypothetical protein